MQKRTKRKGFAVTHDLFRTCELHSERSVLQITPFSAGIVPSVNGIKAAPFPPLTALFMPFRFPAIDTSLVRERVCEWHKFQSFASVRPFAMLLPDHFRA